MNPKVRPFVGKLLSSTLLWCFNFFNFTQFVILENLSVLDLALSEVKVELTFPKFIRPRQVDSPRIPFCYVLKRDGNK